MGSAQGVPLLTAGLVSIVWTSPSLADQTQGGVNVFKECAKTSRGAKLKKWPKWRVELFLKDFHHDTYNKEDPLNLSCYSYSYSSRVSQLQYYISRSRFSINRKQILANYRISKFK